MTIKNALIVDDSKSARVMLQRLLEKLNVACEAVESAEAAFEYLQAEHPDVIFMDHMMPGIDGLEATKAIKENPNTKDIPTVMYTSKDESGYRELAQSHGAQAVLAKPASQQAIMTVLGQIDKLAANDQLDSLVTPQLTNDSLLEIEALISKQIKRASQEARAEITSGLDTISQHLINSQRQHNQNLETKINERLKAIHEQQKAELDNSQLFKKVQPNVQKLAMLIADKMIKQKEEEMVLSTKSQIAKFRSEISEMSKEMEVKQKKANLQTIVIASALGAAIGALVAFVISAL